MGLEDRRVFRVSDGMILVAFLAPALALMRRPEAWPDFWGRSLPVSNFLHRIRYLSYFLSFAAAPFSLALLTLRLRRPRPTLRRMLRQPGMVASVAAMVFWISTVPFSWFSYSLNG
jgi:hypothetical protein